MKQRFNVLLEHFAVEATDEVDGQIDCGRQAREVPDSMGFTGFSYEANRNELLALWPRDRPGRELNCRAHLAEWDDGQAMLWLPHNFGPQHHSGFLEGGSELNDALFRASLVNELHLTICPKIFGGRAAPTLSAGYSLSRQNVVGDIAGRRSGNRIHGVGAVGRACWPPTSRSMHQIRRNGGLSRSRGREQMVFQSPLLFGAVNLTQVVNARIDLRGCAGAYKIRNCDYGQ